MTKRGIFRTINALLWIGVWVATVIWTETYGHWIPMIAQSFIPAMLGGYIHLVLRNVRPSA